MSIGRNSMKKMMVAVEIAIAAMQINCKISCRRHRCCCCHITWINRSYQSHSTINSCVNRVGNKQIVNAKICIFLVFLSFSLSRHFKLPSLKSLLFFLLLSYECAVRTHVGVSIVYANIHQFSLECDLKMIEQAYVHVYDFQ